MERQRTLRRSGKITVAFALFVLVAVSSSAILLSEDEVYAAEMSDGINYNLYTSPNRATVVSLADVSLTDIVIPSTVTFSSNEYTVTSIGDNSFNGSSGLLSVTIPNTVTHIGSRAFFSCKNLISVEFELGSSLKTISSQAFYSSGIKSITIPGSVDTLGINALRSCVELTSVKFESPSSLTTIPTGTFYDCKKLTSIIIPDSVTSIEDEAFTNCAKLASVTIPNSVTTFGYPVFHTNNSFETLIITGEGTTSTILGTSFTWQVPRQNNVGNEISTLIIDASELSIPDITGKASKRVIFTENATNTTGGYFYDSDGSELTAGGRADKTYKYDTTTGKWLALKYTVTFNMNGGTPTVQAEEIYHGQMVTKPATPIKGGYTFVGWFSNTELTVPFDFDKGITANTTVYAGWGYTVTYGEDITVMNGSTEVVSGAAVPTGTVLTVTATDKPGLTYVLSASSGTIGEAGAYMVTANVIFSVTYTNVYTITWMADGNEHDQTTVNYGGSFTFVFSLDASYSESASVVKVNGTAVTLTGGKYTISNITADMAVTVEGISINIYTVTLPSGTGYAVTAVESSSPVDYGGSYTFMFALEASHSKSPAVIKVNGAAVTLTGGKYTISNITADMAVTVEGVVINQYDVTVTSDGEDTAFTYAVDGNDPVEFTAGPGGYDISVSHGSVLVIRVMPGEGHSFKWTDTGSGTVNGNVLTINVTGDNKVGGHLTEDSAAPYMLNIGILALAIPVLLLFAIGRMRARP